MVRCSGTPSILSVLRAGLLCLFFYREFGTVKQKYQIRFFACFNYRMTGTERQVGRQTCCRQR